MFYYHNVYGNENPSKTFGGDTRQNCGRVKTADASKLRTRKRNKRSKRRRCRTAKRGGMIRSSR